MVESFEFKSNSSAITCTVAFKTEKERNESRMMNIGSLGKIMKAKEVFTANHPKFVAFLQAVFSNGVEEGTIIELTVTKPGQDPVTTNIKVQQSDLDMMDSIRELASK